MPKKYNLFLKGYVGDWNFSPDMVAYVLDKYKDQKVNVLIDSLGGSVPAALSISSLFQIHGDVHCHYVGMNASAATIASMGAKHITIDANALFLVHKCMIEVFEWDYMNADELSAHIADLEKMKADNNTVDACIAGMYAKRCKKPKDDLLELMKKGAWLTAQQALEWGFVDEITSADEKEKPVLTDSMVSDIVAAGMPVPPVDVKKGSFLERLLQALGLGQFEKQTINPAEGSMPEAITNNSMPPKTFTSIEAALGTALVLADGSATLTEEQADAIEAALGDNTATIADLNQKITDKDAKIAELEAQVEALRKEPAANTNEPTPPIEEEVDPQKVADALVSIIR